MAWLDPKTIFEIPLQGEYQKRAVNLIRFIRQAVAEPGSCTVPLARLLEIVQFDPAVQARILKNRQDLLLKYPKGKWAGTFENRGRRMRETLPNVPLFAPDMVGEKVIRGRFHLRRDALEMTEIQGLKVLKTFGDDLFDVTYRVELIVLTPQSVAVF